LKDIFHAAAAPLHEVLDLVHDLARVTLDIPLLRRAIVMSALAGNVDQALVANDRHNEAGAFDGFTVSTEFLDLLSWRSPRREGRGGRAGDSDCRE
jgi:hypothetical protein